MSLDRDKLELVSSLKVSCSGDLRDVSQGHPLVWLQIPEELGYVFWPYCEKQFVYQEKLANSQNSNAQ